MFRQAARTRIRSVRLKGGAYIRVLDRPVVNPVVEHALDWARALPTWESPPSAVVIVTWWQAVEGANWNPPHTVDWITRDPDLPMNRLFAVTAAKIRDRGAMLEAKYQTLAALGELDGPDRAS